MTTVPPYAFDLWKKFDKVQISCSIDDLTDRNYYIRYPTKWIDVENNLNKLLQHKWLDVSVNQTVSLYNYWYLQALLYTSNCCLILLVIFSIFFYFWFGICKLNAKRKVSSYE